MDILTTITYINGDYDTFDIYTSNGTLEILYSINIPKSQLLNGFPMNNIPNDTIQIKLISNSTKCNGNITLINLIDTNYIYAERITNNHVKLHINILLDYQSSLYQIIQDSVPQISLSVMYAFSSIDELMTDQIYLTGVDSINTSTNILINRLDIIYDIFKRDISKIDILNMDILINNGTNIVLYQLGVNPGTSLSLTNSEITSSTKNYIIISKTIQ